MDDLINEIEKYFKSQADLYGSELILSKKLKDDPAENSFQDLKKDAKAQKKFNPDATPLKAFYSEIKDCKNCSLGKTRTRFVFGVGNPQAELMFIGEAPGRDEDQQGIPFVGRAGQLLTLMLQAIGLLREDVFIANVLKCRPPNNRDPLLEEIKECEPYLLKQIELISPRLIVTLGRFASASLLRTNAALGKLREDVYTYNEVPLIVTYHPAALLRNPQLKRQAWEDLKKISAYLKKNSSNN
jgi:DNA polymerase